MEEKFTKNDYMGLITSTESQGCDEARIEQAIEDWRQFYSQDPIDVSNFYQLLCYLIISANDTMTLWRIGQAFPEHIRIWAEKKLIELANIDITNLPTEEEMATNVKQ